MARSTDATYPDDPLLATGVTSFMVDEVVAAVVYDNTLFQCSLVDGDLFSASPSEHSKKASEAHSKFLLEVRKLMSQGKYVLIRGWRPQHDIYWSKESISEFKGSMGRKIEFQGRSKLDQTKPI